jgi:hypothetical protein
MFSFRQFQLKGISPCRTSGTEGAFGYGERALSYCLLLQSCLFVLVQADLLRDDCALVNIAEMACGAFVALPLCCHRKVPWTQLQP